MIIHTKGGLIMYKINDEQIERYKKHLKKEEKADATIAKYIHDLQKMLLYTDNRISKELLICYKEHLKKEENYKLNSINSFLAAINHFLKYMNWNDCCVKSYRMQRTMFEPECRCLTKEEYFCLIEFSKENGYETGVIFRTSKGNPVDRSNVWKEMKRLAQAAGINEEKIFPHNLRHLFAKTFYEIDHDLAKLSELLGHSSIVTTQIYIRSSMYEHQKKLEMMHLIP